MKISRLLQKEIEELIHSGKAIVLIGPRQVGKSTLIKEILKSKGDYLYLDGDDFSVQQQLELPNTEFIKRMIGNHTIIFVDEAQRIKNIGITSKIIIDQFPDVQLILSGSSAFDLNNEINEPLTGRKWELNLFPISMEELQISTDFLKANQQLENRIIYGMYPDVFNFPGKEKDVLKNLINSYLYKDVLALTGIKKPDILKKLTQALALQIGNEVSYNELAQLLGVNKETVSNYITLLEKAYVVFKVDPFSRNIRNEIKSNRKIYFYDTGLRNAVISNFNSLDIRNDKGALWENFLISERIKKLNYHKIYTNTYFWRTTQQQEIDWIEEKDGIITAYEFKWQAKSKIKIPKNFVATYQAQTKIIDSNNYYEFIS
ncbi:MAG: ATPase [Bacteroidetes bacterium HGW-Bacteroidetes-12]|nr:MAG: ATPase [Bacteroidetes bacterium HGW-Bacteroidetes-12]